jgi:hypothetical protein
MFVQDLVVQDLTFAALAAETYNLVSWEAQGSRENSDDTARPGPRPSLKDSVLYDGADSVVEDLSGTHGDAVAYGLAFRTHSRISILYGEH